MGSERDSKVVRVWKMRLEELRGALEERAQSEADIGALERALRRERNGVAGLMSIWCGPETLRTERSLLDAALQVAVGAVAGDLQIVNAPSDDEIRKIANYSVHRSSDG